VIANETVEFFDKVSGRIEGATTDSALGNRGEEPFGTWLSRRLGGREVNVPAWTAGEPSSDLWMLVGCVVVDDEMDVELVRHIGLDTAQESEELLMTMRRARSRRSNAPNPPSAVLLASGVPSIRIPRTHAIIMLLTYRTVH
jgi:hypothetical protein